MIRDEIMEILTQFGGQNLYIKEVRENVTYSLIDILVSSGLDIPTENVKENTPNPDEDD